MTLYMVRRARALRISETAWSEVEAETAEEAAEMAIEEGDEWVEDDRELLSSSTSVSIVVLKEQSP